MPGKKPKKRIWTGAIGRIKLIAKVKWTRARIAKAKFQLAMLKKENVRLERRLEKAKKPKKRIWTGAIARIKNAKAKRDGKAFFAEGYIWRGAEMVVDAGYPALAKKMVKKEIARFTKRIRKAQIDLESFGEIPKSPPPPDKPGGFYYPENWETLLIFEKAEKLKKMREALKELMKLQKELVRQGF